MALRRRLIIFAGLFFAAVVFDWLKFLFAGKSNLINWYSFAHPLWVISSLVLFGIGIWLWRVQVWQILFWLYFFVFGAAFLNQFLAFSETMTYNCMLFNLVFAALYFVLSAPVQHENIRKSEAERENKLG